MSFDFFNMRVLLVFSTTWFLAACGGGTASSTAPDEIALSKAQTVVSTYVPGSEERLAFDLLNAERMRCGFGELSQNFSLDRAAKAHARWSIFNQQLTHEEDGKTYPVEFTGTGVGDRVRAQGYPLGSGDAGEVYAAFVNLMPPSSLGLSAVKLLFNAPYHLIYLTGPYREVGVSSQRPSDLGLASGLDQLVMELGRTASDGRQDLMPDVIATYPCEGSGGLVYSLSHESPNPLPGRNLAVSPLGVSIVIRVRQGQKLDILSVAVAQTRTGRAVTMRSHVGGANGSADPYREFDASAAYVVADAPMQADTSYTAHITGKNNGVDFVKNFTFTTGNLAFHALSQ